MGHAPTAPILLPGSSGHPLELCREEGEGAVLHFFTRLRRHASLEGASPYFKIKKWKLESSQRASSLDTRGSPKRHQFQRQRAASESMDQEDRDAHQTDIIQYIARTEDVVFRPTAGPLLPAPASPTLSLGRYFSVDKWERAGRGRIEPPKLPPSPPAESPALDQPPAPLYHDIWSLRASLERYAASASASPAADHGTDRESVRSDDGGDGLSSSGGLRSFPSSLVDEAEEEDRPWGKPKQDSVESESGTRKLLQMDSGYASIEPRRSGSASPAPGARPPSLRAPARRDYSIDEKTDALFNGFMRHDPKFDESPLRARHRSRTHLAEGVAGALRQYTITKAFPPPPPPPPRPTCHPSSDILVAVGVSPSCGNEVPSPPVTPSLVPSPGNLSFLSSLQDSAGPLAARSSVSPAAFLSPLLRFQVGCRFAVMPLCYGGASGGDGAAAQSSGSCMRPKCLVLMRPGSRKDSLVPIRETGEDGCLGVQSRTRTRRPHRSDSKRMSVLIPRCLPNSSQAGA
uniref:Uncharacterized protein n=1 Tax=Anolis carolinensis TaxID=28377 RepID=H9GSU2_ANOCA